VLIELFSLGVMADALRANIGWKFRFRANRSQLTQNFRLKASPPTNRSSQKLG